MKLLKVKSRVYNGKVYYKYRVNLPEEIVKKAKLKEGDKLKTTIKSEEIRLKKHGRK
jgi:bifunctional DNA-binding transcriptional regulator/antitoxin component of YhaV-PrlF toxin-antitoxin module